MSDHSDQDGTAAERAEPIEGGGVFAGGAEFYYRVNLTHNSKSSNLETTATVKCRDPRALAVAIAEGEFDLAAMDAVLGALLRQSFAVAREEATRRGKPLVEVQPMEEPAPVAVPKIVSVSPKVGLDLAVVWRQPLVDGRISAEAAEVLADFANPVQQAIHARWAGQGEPGLSPELVRVFAAEFNA